MSVNATQQAPTEQTYAFDNDAPDAADQVRLLSAILDPDTVAALDDLGVQPGWQCLDIGAGAGSVTRWLADQVGETGHVTAMDIKPQHIGGGDNITVVTDDICTADLKPDHYDLIHARLVLLHLPNREWVLDRLVAATRPGGWVVLSEWDCSEPGALALHLPDGEASTAFAAYQDILNTFMAKQAADPGWARRVPQAMRNSGLADVRAVVATRLWHGNEPGCLLHKSGAQQLRGLFLNAGMTHDQLVALGQAMVDPETLMWQYPLITTMGRRPTR